MTQCLAFYLRTANKPVTEPISFISPFSPDITLYFYIKHGSVYNNERRKTPRVPLSFIWEGTHTQHRQIYIPIFFKKSNLSNGGFCFRDDKIGWLFQLKATPARSLNSHKVYWFIPIKLWLPGKHLARWRACFLN